MNTYLISGALIASFLSLATGFKLGVDHAVARQAREQKHITEAIQVASAASAEAIANIKVINKTIQNEVQREVQNNIVYRDCKHSAASLHLINESLTNSKSDDNRKLP